jgi:hypothetical protein
MQPRDGFPLSASVRQNELLQEPVVARVTVRPSITGPLSLRPDCHRVGHKLGQAAGDDFNKALPILLEQSTVEPR